MLDDVAAWMAIGGFTLIGGWMMGKVIQFIARVSDEQLEDPSWRKIDTSGLWLMVKLLRPGIALVVAGAVLGTVLYVVSVLS